MYHADKLSQGAKGGSLSVRKIQKYIFLIFIGLFLIVGCGVRETNDPPILKPISVDSIDWAYLSEDGNYMRVASVTFSFDPPGSGHLSGSNFVDMFKLFKNNSDRVFATEKPNTFKVYLRFGKVGKLSEAYAPDKYDGKECTFYVDKTLNEKLEKLFSQ
jgi:hypothetical protein